MKSPDTQSKPLRERLVPQTSIRFFMFLIGVSAMVMYTFRAAFLGDQFWAKIVSLLIVTCGGCFIAYAMLFLVASLFTATTIPLLRTFDPLPSEPQQTEPQQTEPQQTEPQQTEPQQTEPQQTEPQQTESQGSGDDLDEGTHTSDGDA